MVISVQKVKGMPCQPGTGGKNLTFNTNFMNKNKYSESSTCLLKFEKKYAIKS